MAAAISSSAALGATAHWTAAVRAMESRRADRLLDDPWAEALAGAIGMNWIAARTADNVVSIVLRTRYFDDYLLRITHQDAIRQIVLLGAGLDTRAYRLNWPEGVRLYELDQAAVLDTKHRILASTGARPNCLRHIIGADVTGGWAEGLVAAGFMPSQPSGWLIEGLLFYLPTDTIVRLLDAVSALASGGSRLGFDSINGAMLTSPITQAWIQMQASLGAPWIGTLDDPVEALAERGWAATLTQAGQPDANHGRWTLPVFPTDMPNFPHNWFVTAVKQ